MNAPKVPSGPGPWMRFAREIIAWINEVKPISGQGCNVSQQSGGRAVNVRNQASPVNPIQTYPFQVTLIQQEDMSWKVWVDGEGSLLASAQPNNNVTIGQLGEVNAFPILSTGDLIYLAVTWTPNITGTIATCKVTSFGDGGSFDPTLAAWSSGASYVFDDGGTPPIQSGLCVPIAQITFDGDGVPTTIPLTTNNLLLDLSLEALIPAYLAVPFYGRYQG